METQDTMQGNAKPQVKLLRLDNYLAAIEGSIGSELFRHVYASVAGVRKDLVEDGRTSCAYFVSGVLTMANVALLAPPDAPNTTVAGLMRSLERFGWQKVASPSTPGEIIIWEKMAQARGEQHLHAGFYIGGERAVSHVDSTRTPQEHHITFGAREDGSPMRRIIAVYTHKLLAQ